MAGIIFVVWGVFRNSSSSLQNQTKTLYYREDATRSTQFPRQPISDTAYGVVDLDKEQWTFADFFFPEEMVLRKPATDGLVLYHQGYEYVSFRQDPPLHGRTAFQRGVLGTVIDPDGQLLLLEARNDDVVVWELFTEAVRDTFSNVLDDRDIISLGYHPQSRYCGILYHDFTLEVFDLAGTSVFSYVSQTSPPPQEVDRSGQYQNIYFRDASTLYFFDRVVLVKVNLAGEIITPVYTVTGLERHTGYHYTFNAFSNTVSLFSEYCAGCDIGGEILVLNVDTLVTINRLSTREHGQIFNFCKYYDDKFVTAGSLFETFTIHEIGDEESVEE